MGQTDAYLLPWPDLPELADGPDGFMDLALATEAAIKNTSGGLVKTWNNYYAPDRISSGGSPVDSNLGSVNLPAPARTVIITYSLTVAVGTGGQHDLYGYWDEQQVFFARMQTHSDSRTMDRSYVFTTAIKNQAAGDHSFRMRSWPAGSCYMSIKAMIGSVVALG
ncbi:MAG TPA: hypothetical protein VIT65_11240 [Microlunatus sp.]